MKPNELKILLVIIGLLFTAYFFLEDRLMNKTREIVKTEIFLALQGGSGDKLEIINSKLDSLIGRDFNQ